jgi:multidrug transporter EmrE-like cation transporter
LGVVAGAVLLNEQLTMNKIIGIAVMLAGAFIIAK